MKALLLVAIAFAVLSTPSFASSNSQMVQFFEAVTVGSMQFPAGEYKVTWNGTGPKVQVSLARDGKKPVTVEAKLVPQDNPEQGITVEAKNGATLLHAIRLKHCSLLLDDDSIHN